MHHANGLAGDERRLTDLSVAQPPLVRTGTESLGIKDSNLDY
jgi:hypothetical protein